MNFETVIFEKFGSLQELARTIEKRPYNSIFANGTRSSERRSHSEYDSFFGSAKSFKQAIELMNYGYKEPMEQMKRAILKIDKKQHVPVKRPQLSMVGFVPHVPNAIQGLPESMITREKRKEKQKTIHLLYGFSALGNVSARDLIKGGVNFISLVNSLEKQGYRIKIDIVRCTTTERTAIGYLCNVKEYANKLNLLKLCFPLVHPSMLRRISFRWCETLPELQDGRFYGSYGQSLIGRMGFDNEKEKQFLRDNGILKGNNQYYCNVYEAMQANDINELAQKMGLVR